jgi:putative phosphoesterase
MVKIGLISDTHDYLDPKVEKYFAECDEIWHAGDFGTVRIAKELEKIAPVRGVFGNIDGQDIRIRYPEHARFQIEGLTVWMTHIGGYPGRYNPKIRARIYEEKPDLFISGHSHILKVMPDKKVKNLLHMNPGAAGKHGFHKVKTIMRFEIDQGKIQNLQAIELGPRVKKIEEKK